MRGRCFRRRGGRRELLDDRGWQQQVSRRHIPASARRLAKVPLGTRGVELGLLATRGRTGWATVALLNADHEVFGSHKAFTRPQYHYSVVPMSCPVGQGCSTLPSWAE